MAGENAATRERILRDLLASPRKTPLGTARALNAYEPKKLLSRYSGPQLAVVATQSDTPAALHRMTSDLPHRTLHGVGHWLHPMRRRHSTRSSTGSWSMLIEAKSDEGCASLVIDCDDERGALDRRRIASIADSGRP
jgi:hypothetical protein